MPGPDPKRSARSSPWVARLPKIIRVDFRRFTLKYAHTPGDTTYVYPRSWTGSEWQTNVNEDAAYEVWDARAVYRGRGQDDFSSPNDRGSYGEAMILPGSDLWVMTWLEPHALMLKGLLTAALATTDSTFTIDGVSILQPAGGLIIDQDPAQDMTIRNTFSCEGDNNGIVIAEWNEANPGWEAQGIECPA